MCVCANRGWIFAARIAAEFHTHRAEHTRIDNAGGGDGAHMRLTRVVGRVLLRLRARARLRWLHHEWRRAELRVRLMRTVLLAVKKALEAARW